ncbi:MAG: FAD:protein FMN transferase [Chlamydiae bacterium]|nr:FAD:protein FMN transferase [Chlamydiota bacterium]
MNKILVFILLLAGCSKSQDTAPTNFTGTQMSVDYNILIGDSLTDKEVETVALTINAVFEKIHTIFDKHNSVSELSKFNQAKANEKCILSKDLKEALLFCKQMYVHTHGRFDPTIEKIQKIWLKHLKNHEIPKEVSNASIGFDKVHIEGNTVSKDENGIEIDLDAILKGRGADMLQEAFKNLGLKNYFINWGGEIYAQGEHPQKRPWTALIRPVSKKGKGIPIPVQNAAIATSLDYFKNYKVGKITYLPVFNPRTGRPFQMKKHGIASASVVAPTCQIADAIATSIMLFENEIQLDAFLELMKTEYGEMSFWILKRTEL